MRLRLGLSDDSRLLRNDSVAEALCLRLEKVLLRLFLRLFLRLSLLSLLALLAQVEEALTQRLLISLVRVG